MEDQIGHESFVGSGAVVREGVRIGARSLVAGGARVIRDLPENSIYKEFIMKVDQLLSSLLNRVNHNGNLETAKRLIEIAAKTGADLVKFRLSLQTGW